MLYHAENGTYPTAINCANPTATEVCVSPSPNNTYIYNANNTTNPPSFYLSTSNGKYAYQATSSSPTEVVPTVVTDGLVLNLDAANAASYPGAGDVWNDFSGSGGAGTLFGTPPYSSANGGYFTFNGSTQYATFYAPNLTTTATIEMWCKVINPTSKMFMGFKSYDVYYHNGSIGYNTGAGDLFGVSSANVTALSPVGSWKHYIFEMRSDVPYTNNKIYVNGALQPVSQVLASEGAVNRHFNGGYGGIGTWLISGSYRMPMLVGYFSVYNRSLTSAEVAQNFNALRGRYGI